MKTHPTLFKAASIFALTLAISCPAHAAEPFAAGLNKWALDRSTAAEDASFAVDIPASGNEPLVVHFFFPERPANAAPQVRSIFDSTSFAAFGPDGDKTVVMRLKIKSDNPGRHVRLRLVDANSEVFDTKPQKVDGDYSTLEFPLDIIEAHWGGDDNGQIDWPLKMIRIETVDWNGASPKQAESLSIESLSADF